MIGGAKLVLVGLLLVGTVVVGRWEGTRSVRADQHGIARVKRLAGPLRSPRLTAYQLTPTFDCLLYSYHGDPYALELCFGADARVIEAYDRRGGTLRVYTLRTAPNARPLYASGRALFSLFEHVGAFAGQTFAGTLPLGAADRGPIPVSRRAAKRP